MTTQRHTRPDRGDPRRARLAARHAERLYPAPLGRLVAHELRVWAECSSRPADGLAESVIAEVLDRTAPVRDRREARCSGRAK